MSAEGSSILKIQVESIGNTKYVNFKQRGDLKKKERTASDRKLTIVDRLVRVDVDRTKLEPGVVPGLTKFTHFISTDGAAIRMH